ncbi:MAG: adaptor protein MecA [Lachnospiraceae bacterium]
MKFRKIDENTISCILSEEDMLENNIALEDFFRDKNKVHDFMDVLIQKAKEEVGFEMSGDLFSLQIMPLPKNGLAITFSDSTQDGAKGIIEQLRHTMEQVEAETENLPPQELEHILQGMMEEIEDLELNKDKLEKVSNKKINSKKKQNTAVKMCIYKFDSMENLEEFCSLPKLEKNIKSSLYKDEIENTYYLILEKGRLSVKKFDFCCGLAMDFSNFISNKLIQKSYCEEHYTCILNKKAVSFLCDMIGVQ